ncbi:elongator complex protein 3 [Desulfuribacillus alkaliarsenatis]|uniref:Radical SAM core domain-containing protein n=1 Tax=Desulfuribacillus alkaliarsenatis TaxID=766136 RepID=A0A1E5G744_9FIRM|nr:radical SAM protein [Desulfuribacillus alkaliarsenatis]OEF98564.1 hypothetical protein BHF68_02555 [Desulfuribacillus alkaliarsenatis]
MQKKIISIFVSHLGCPHDCAYCNQEKITGHKKALFRSMVDIKTDIENQLATINCNQNHVEIAFYGGSFTGLPIEYQIQLLELAKSYVKANKLLGIRFSTRPDYVTPDIINYLKAYPISAIELGVQSLDDNVLKLSKRGHTSQHVYDAVEAIKNTGFKLGIQIMTGLPGDSMQSVLDTAERVITLKPDFVRIYPTLVLAGTDLADWYKQGQYTPWTVEETINNIAKILPLFFEADIPIIRLGLQENQDLQKIGTIIAGPHRPNIRQLIESQYYLSCLYKIGDDLFKDRNGEKHKDLSIIIHPADETAVRGKSNINIKKFTERYSCKVSIIKDLAQPRNFITLHENV